MKRGIAVLFLAATAELFASPIDGEQVYKSNCTRCHIAMHAYSEKMSRVIVRHMRVRAMLTQEEADAVLAYLLESSPEASSPKIKKVADKR
jgi:mono/diheme cytochrome c family protein